MLFLEHLKKHNCSTGPGSRYGYLALVSRYLITYLTKRPPLIRSLGPDLYRNRKKLLYTVLTGGYDQLNEIPSSIDLVENKMTLSLYESSWEIGYVFSSIIPLDFQVTDLNVNPSNPKVGEEVTVSVKVTNVGEQIGSYTIPFVVNQTTEETKTLTLESGESSIITFKIIKQIQGIYTFEVGGIYGTFEVEPSNNISSTSFPLEYVIILIVTVTAVFFVAILLFKRRKVNVDKIFKLNPQLNKEEKDVIQFLADNEAKAFESIIRDKFPDIPRTSLWRMVKRLEKLEIVKVKKIGLENQVELKK